MIAASTPVQRPSDAQLLVVDRCGAIAHWPRTAFAQWLGPGDLVIANDAATLPASLRGVHGPSGSRIEVRLAARTTLDPARIGEFTAVVFGDGDFRTRTEDRKPPPALRPSDALTLGPLNATVTRLLGHARLIGLRFEGSPADIWRGLAQHGKPIQYAHLAQPLALWDTWTPVAGTPAAFESPSAGFVLNWAVLAALRGRGAQFATLTHAAGISSTGDPTLDVRLPFDEPYRIAPSTARAIARTQARGGRIVAVGTTVVRALEHAATRDGRVPAGEGLATQRIGATTRLRVVDAILSGTHERGSSHYELLKAFVDDATLLRMDEALEARAYRTHEFGDSVLVERSANRTQSAGTENADDANDAALGRALCA